MTTNKAVRLRDQLAEVLRERALVPDQKGELRRLSEVSYPPEGLAESALQRWAAYDNRPTDWLHHRSMTRNRLAVLNRIIPSRVYRHWDSSVGSVSGLRHASIEQWLEALVEKAKSQQPGLADNLDALRQRAPYLSREDIQRIEAQREQPIVEASMAAIQTAALIPESIRANNELGSIVLTAYGEWGQPDPDKVFLGGLDTSNASNRNLVHPQLESDPETLNALKELGIKLASQETEFRSWASMLLNPSRELAAQLTNETVLDSYWDRFWTLAHHIDPSEATGVVKDSNSDWRESLRVRTVDGRWRSLFRAATSRSYRT